MYLDFIKQFLDVYSNKYILSSMMMKRSWFKSKRRLQMPTWCNGSIKKKQTHLVFLKEMKIIH